MRIPPRVGMAAVFTAGLAAWAVFAGRVVPGWLSKLPPDPSSPLMPGDRLLIWSHWAVLIAALWCMAFAARAAGPALHRILRAGPAVRAGGVLVIAAAAGLAGGFGEALAPIVRVRSGYSIGTGMIWMMPASALIGFLMLACAVVLATRSWSRPVSIRPLVLGFGGLALFGVIRAVGPGLHAVAAALLAAGAAERIAAFAVARPAGVRRTARALAGGLGVLVLLFAAAVDTYASLRERRTLAAIRPASGAAPDIILLILDTVRARSLDLYGYERPTAPRLTALARDGITFERAVSTAPWTLPSHASFFTGRPAHELDAGYRTPLADHFPTLAEMLRDRGYRTGGFVGNLWYASRETGLARGFLHYEDYRPTPGTLIAFHWVPRRLAFYARTLVGVRTQLGRPDAATVNARFLRWLDRDRDRPVFAFLNYFDAHHPYETEEPFWRTFTDRPPRHWVYAGPGRTYSPDELREITNAYDSAIRYTDHQLGLMLDALERRGRLDDAIIIVTSDHGELLGEHGLINHGNALYMELLHVPLVIRLPEGAAGARVADPVSLTDLPATVLDLAGVEPGTLPGRSLRQHWTGNPPTRPLHSFVAYDERAEVVGPVSRGDMHSLVVDRLHYIRNGDGVEELFDIFADPDELVDLSRDQRFAVMLPPMRRLMPWLSEPAVATGERR